MDTKVFETYTISQKRFTENAKYLFDIYLSEEMYQIVEKIRKNSIRFGDCYYIRQGIIALPKDKYLIPTTQAYEKLDVKLKNLCKNVLEGEDVQRYWISWEGKYLVYKKEELHRPRTEDIFERKKLIIPRIATQLRAVYDDENFYCLERLYVAYPRKSDFNSRFFLGVLNSRLVDFYYKSQYIPTHLSGAYLKYYKTYLEQIPIKEVSPDNKTLADKIIEKANEIQLAYRQIKNLKKKIRGFPNSYFTGKEEFKILRDLVSRKELSKNFFMPSKKLTTSYYRDLQGNDVYRISLDKDNYVEFHLQDVASYVFEALKVKNAITSQELIKLEIPLPEKTKLFLSSLLNDRNLLKRLHEKIKEIDREIDSTVYELYGITYKERFLIENYLKRH